MHWIRNLLAVVQQDVAMGLSKAYPSLAGALVRVGSRGAEAQHLRNGKQVPRHVSHASQVRHP